MPKSGEQDVHTPPRLVVASMAMIGLGQVGQVAGDAIARPQSQVAQPRGNARDFRVQFEVTELAPRCRAR